MNLISYLMQVFPSDQPCRIEVKADELRKLGVHSVYDLKYLNDEIMKGAHSFSYVETNKLIDVATNPSSRILRHVLMEIFKGAPENRVDEIEAYLRQKRIYQGKDVLVVRPEVLQEDDFFSDAELLKIHHYIVTNDDDVKETPIDLMPLFAMLLIMGATKNCGTFLRSI